MSKDGHYFDKFFFQSTLPMGILLFCGHYLLVSAVIMPLWLIFIGPLAPPAGIVALVAQLAIYAYFRPRRAKETEQQSLSRKLTELRPAKRRAGVRPAKHSCYTDTNGDIWEVVDIKIETGKPDGIVIAKIQPDTGEIDTIPVYKFPPPGWD